MRKVVPAAALGLALVFAACSGAISSSTTSDEEDGEGKAAPEKPHVSAKDFEEAPPGPSLPGPGEPRDAGAARGPMLPPVAGLSPDAGEEPFPLLPRPGERDGAVRGPDAAAPQVGPVGGPCALQVTEVALYQAVKVPLAKDGAPVAALNAPVIRNRPALFRAFVRPGAAFGMKEAELRLVVKSAAGDKSFTDKKVVRAASDDATMASTFNFAVPAEALGADARYAVEVVSPAGCADARTPATGEQALKPVQTGTLKVTLVPIKYDADGSGRLPDVSELQLKRYRDYLMAMYPVARVDLTVRAPVSSTITLTNSGNWPRMLEQMRSLRAQDAPASDVYYYGLVNPASTGDAYCGGGCVGGIAYKTQTAAPGERAGLGLGFTTGTVALETLAHELGHEHGRAHAPCGMVAGADTRFPGGKGDVGVWGYDLVAAKLLSPTGRTDIMGYCRSKWISDYTYAALAVRSAAVNGASVVRRVIGEPMTARRVLLLDEGGHPSWGLPADGVIYGAAETARVLDAAGAVVATVPVHRMEIADSGHASILVPAPQPGWASLLVDGATRALPFDEAPVVPAFGD